MDQLIISFVVALSFLLQFAMQVLAVVVALWIWHRWLGIVAIGRHPSPQTFGRQVE